MREPVCDLYSDALTDLFVNNGSLFDADDQTISDRVVDLQLGYKFDYRTRCDLNNKMIDYICFAGPEGRAVVRRDHTGEIIGGVSGSIHDSSFDSLSNSQLANFDSVEGAIRGLTAIYQVHSPASEPVRYSNSLTCPICGNQNSIWLEENEVSECLDCGVAHRVNAVERSTYFNRIYAADDGHYFAGLNDSNSSGSAHGYEFYEEWIDVIQGQNYVNERAALFHSLAPNATRCLEVGCASGSYLSALSSRGLDALGVELSPPAANRGRIKYRLNIEVGTIQSLRSAPDFDMILYMDVFEHLAEPLVELNEIKHRLAPGGVLILELPNQTSIEATVTGRDFLFGEHLYFYGPRGISAVLNKAGFEPIAMSSAPDVYFAIDRFMSEKCVAEATEKLSFERLVVAATPTKA
jgi:2-polyprenyl-3-methyl-5-hydroxy-6-metoxy-1,4-benzoquinol methylase